MLDVGTHSLYIYYNKATYMYDVYQVSTVAY